MSKRVPQALLSEAPDDRIGGRTVAAVFTTFSFGPGFLGKQVLPVLFHE